VIQMTSWKPLLLFHCDIDDITPKWQNQVEKEKGMKKAILGLSFIEKEQEKITLQPNIYRKEKKKHQIENQRLSTPPFGLIRVQNLLVSNTRRIDPQSRKH
jgi:hypothetical protein